jgi:hypothetical protein
MALITVKLGDREHSVDTEALTPKARALAETLRTTLGAAHLTAILLRSTRPLRDMPAGQVPGIDLWYTTDQLDSPDLVTWDSWSYYPPDSTVPASLYLEQQAARLPIDYWPVPDRHAQIPAYADEDELLTRDRVFEILRVLGQPMTRSPKPDEYIGRTPRWRMSTIKSWAGNRPGRGARTDLIKP